MKLHLAQEFAETTSDGPGIRYSVYVQGCRGGLHGECVRHCPGCYSPQTWSFSETAPGAYWLSVDELVEKVRQARRSFGRLTLCGGDPIWQAEACIELVRKLRDLKPSYSVWAYSGLTMEYILARAGSGNRWREYLESLDVLVDGPFLLEARDITLPWRGSSNQRVIDVRKSLEAGEVVLFS